MKFKNGKKKWKEKIWNIKQQQQKKTQQKYIHDFQQYETVRSFCDNIYADKINIDEAKMDQSNLLKYFVEFNKIDKFRWRTIKGKDKKRNFCEKAYALYEGRGLILNA